MFSDIAALKPKTKIGARLVTTHGDLHSMNTLQLVGGNVDRICIDFEYTCVTHAVLDLSYMLNFMENLEKKHAFLGSYLEAIGEPADELDALMIDCHVAHLTSWWNGGILSPWTLYGSS